jgi:hypothetical protein
VLVNPITLAKRNKKENRKETTVHPVKQERLPRRVIFIKS